MSHAVLCDNCRSDTSRNGQSSQNREVQTFREASAAVVEAFLVNPTTEEER